MTLSGEEFIGPYERIGEPLGLVSIVASVDLWEIIERHGPTD